MHNPTLTQQVNSLCIQRQAFKSQHELDEAFLKCRLKEEQTGVNGYIAKHFKSINWSCTTFSNHVRKLLPILTWLPNYSWSEHVIADIAAGLTVAVMHIPQGMGYALLGNVEPIIGLYMAFFPVLVYILFGTSHHVSMGTFAVITLMTGKVVDQYCGVNIEAAHSLHAENSTWVVNSTSPMNITNIEVATAVCLMVGLMQVAMSILRLGVIGVILSDHLVSGFTTAAAVHVLVTQVRNLLGLTIPRFNGPFKLMRTIGAIFMSLPSTNVAELLISFLILTFMVAYNHWLKSKIEKVLHFPFPIELCIIIITTVSSYFGNFNDAFNVRILHHIPTGLPPPRVPPLAFLPRIVVDSLTIAVVSYAISLSLAKIFAHRHHYKISDNQELFAQGAANVFGSFFSCMPISASLSRSMLQESVGGKTQLASVISCVLLLFVLLWLGPLFQPLPLCVLSSIVVVALKGMFLQVKDFVRAVKVAPFEAVVWMVTFVSVIVIDVEIGLAIGAITSVSLLIYRGNNPYHAVLGRLPDTELHEDLKLFPCAVEEEGIKIFRWVGAINFTNVDVFRRAIEKCLEAEKQERVGNMFPSTSTSEIFNNPEANSSYGSLDHNQSQAQQFNKVKYLILDCSGVSYIDLAGSETLSSISIYQETKGTILVFASCSDYLTGQLDRTEFFLSFPKCRLYPSILDAISSINEAE